MAPGTAAAARAGSARGGDALPSRAAAARGAAGAFAPRLRRRLPGRPRLRRVLLLALLLSALLQLGGAALIHARAGLAPLLLERAWQRSLALGQPVRPWPWADARPVARLAVPRLQLERIVLDGDSGHALAFAPGLSPAAATPGTPGLAVISAHRDTHFRFLRRLRPGDRVFLDHGGERLAYRVQGYRIADARAGRVPGPLPRRGLLLVTCYPFDAVVSGGPLRYVVVAAEER